MSNEYEGMSHDQWCLAAAYKAVTSRPIEEIAARKPGICDWVFVDDYPAYNPHTGKPVTSHAGTLRQIFEVVRVDGNGNVTEVNPRVLNYPHGPAVIVEITPVSRVRCYDPRVAFLEAAQ